MNERAFTENAFVFKDTTQWLRNRTFVFLFFGLLFLSLVIYGFSANSHARVGKGMVAALFLGMLLFVYMLALAGSAWTRASREYQSGTFDLFVLSGMAPERIVRGKLYSLFLQFAFGLFCIGPFLFISFFLGGLSPFAALHAVFCIGLVAPPLFLLIFAFSFASRKTPLRFMDFFLAGLLLSIAVMYLASYVDEGYSHGRHAPFFLSPPDGPEFFEELLNLAVLYVPLVLFLYHCACHLLDKSRGEYVFKMHAFFSLFFLANLFVWETGQTYLLAHALPLVSLYPFFLLLWLLFNLYKPLPALQAARPMPGNKRQKALAWMAGRFGAGPDKVFRVAAFLWFLTVALLLYIGWGGGAFRLDRSVRTILFPLVLVPYLAALPGVLLFAFQAVRQNPKKIIWLAAAFWTLVSFGAMYVERVPDLEDIILDRDAREVSVLVQDMCLLVSPIPPYDMNPGLTDRTWRLVLTGGAGVLILAIFLYARTRSFKKAGHGSG